MSKRTAADVLAEMDTISRADDLDVAAYEALEGELGQINKADEIVKRQAAYKSVNVNVLPTATGANSTGDDEVSRAFDQYMRTGRADNTIQRAQGEGTSAAGGFLVPEGFRATIIEAMKAFGGVQGGADSISTSSGQPLPWPTNDDTANVGAIAAENAGLGSGADLVFGTKILGAYTYTSNGTGNAALKVPYELIQDSAFDLGGFVGRKLAERIQRKVAVDLVVGSGSGEPTGLLSTAGGLSQTAALSSNTAPTYADLLTIVHSVDPAYRDDAVWVFNDAFLKTLRGVVDTTGRPLLWNNTNDLTNSLKGQQTLLGFPVIIDQACPTPSVSNSYGFFGNLRKAFIVRTVRDISLVTLMEKYAENRQVGYMAWARFDAAVQDTSAGKILLAHS